MNTVSNRDDGINKLLQNQQFGGRSISFTLKRKYLLEEECVQFGYIEVPDTETKCVSVKRFC